MENARISSGANGMTGRHGAALFNQMIADGRRCACGVRATMLIDRAAMRCDRCHDRAEYRKAGPRPSLAQLQRRCRAVDRELQQDLRRWR